MDREITDKTGVAERQKPETTPEDYEIRSIPIEQIKVADFCRRRALKKDLKSLTESIQRRGLIQSPVVLDSNNGAYSLIAGSRRFQACKALGWKTIPCCIKKIDTKDATFLSFAENAVREMVHPLEEARKLKQIKEDTGMTDDEIGEEVGLAQSTVTDRLSILELGDDILEKIDIRPEAAFKPTHAVVLAQVQRTNRYNREIEIRELQSKTIEHKLSSGQLRSLVLLFKNGDYDHLPEKLQMLLMKDKKMDAKMVKLFLHPEEFIDDSVSEAELLRGKASELAKQQRESFVEDALNNNWSEKEIKARLIKLIRVSMEPEEDYGDKRLDSTAETLSSNLVSLMDKLQNTRYQIHSLVKSKPDEAARLRKMGLQLIRQLRSFLRSVTEVASEK